ncbi:putative phosphoribosyl transferasec [mine drainage metagenome]|jgi:pimeloyl-ACP methyl ester carboxylesterase|uniref:Putative phosphoribosyl transferasec n=1 Tax=mine drainage metagenome TaxID=410659 RepID=A0A1J5Q716_9ZZZZ|nr:dienelactone hydrolase family protein [Metallibacterium scheffleri]MCK9366328.1 dienelactone hydrolase family protein [Metallibacterium scheffleri]
MSPVQILDVALPSGGALLQGSLVIPPDALGIVAFAHGSGSSRFSSRNQRVAQFLNQARLATLLFDLLTAEENTRDLVTAEYRFDIPLLARRLTDAVDWLSNETVSRSLAVGLFGASTGAAAALITAADRPHHVGAVVSRGGRPDLAGEALGRVHAPTLLIVGGWDTDVIALNEQAAQRLSCEHRTIIVPEATHLFEEPGKLDEVSRLASAWFVRCLSAADV